LDPDTREPASLTYLRTLQLNPNDVVRLVIVTHWDDDHIRGITKVVRECTQATVAWSAALTREDFLQLVFEEEQNAAGTGSGLDELRSVLRLSNGRRVAAKNNTLLYPRPPRDGPSVVALSPSEDSVERGIFELVERATGRPRAVSGRFRAPDEPNAASIAASATSGEHALLMGGDLEASSNEDSGWDAVLTHAAPQRAASLVKVPHHGSDDAHHAQMWDELVEPGAVAILTPFSNGNVHRPAPEDIERICTLGVDLYATALPELTRAKLDHAVARAVKRSHGGDVMELRGWGHVRGRRRLTAAAWTVEIDGDAVQLGASP
jgi:hypothetical protein